MTWGRDWLGNAEQECSPASQVAGIAAVIGCYCIGTRCCSRWRVRDLTRGWSAGTEGAWGACETSSSTSCESYSTRWCAWASNVIIGYCCRACCSLSHCYGGRDAYEAG